MFKMAEWAWDYWKEQLEKGKKRGKELKKKHKSILKKKLKKIKKSKGEEDEG